MTLSAREKSVKARPLPDAIKQKQAHEALLQEKKSLEDITAHANCGLLLLDNRARVIYANRVAQEWFGPSRQIEGRFSWEVFDFGEGQEKSSALEVLRSGTTVRSDTFGKVVGGEEKFFYVVASPLRGAHGKTDQVSMVVIDVTERTRLEEQLRQAQKLEAVGLLAGGIAHDFNNVITGIIGFSELSLQSLPEDHPATDYIEAIINKAHKAGSLVRQLLAFSSKQILKFQPVNLNSIVLNSTRFLERVIGEHISLTTDLADDLKLTIADPNAVEQIITNLCLNARDAMPAGGYLGLKTENVELDGQFCLFHEADDPGSYVKLSVTDSGVGIDEETQQHIFEPFFTTKEPGLGTGLGLSTVYGLVQQHHGFIDFVSKPGKKTTFEVFFPSMQGQSDEKGSREPGNLSST